MINTPRKNQTFIKILGILLILGFCFIISNSAFAETIKNDQIKEIPLSPDDEDLFDLGADQVFTDFDDDLVSTGYPEIYNIYILNKKHDDIDFSIKFSEKDLVNGEIIITGEAKTDIGSIESVEVTLDEGQSFQAAEGKNHWRFAFSPKENHEYNFSARALDTSGGISYFDDLNIITITYAKYSIKKEVSLWFKNFREAYRSEDLKEMMKLISQGFSPDYHKLKSSVKNEFKTFNNLSISFYLTYLKVNEFEDEAIVSFAFKKERNGNISKGKSKILLRKDSSTGGKKGKAWKLITIRGDQFI